MINRTLPRPTVMAAAMMANHGAYMAKVRTGGSRLERRNSAGLADAITKISEGFEAHRASVEELRKRVEQAETRMARPGAFAGQQSTATGSGEVAHIAPPTEAERKAFNLLMRTGDRQYAVEARASINAGTTGQGLETVAPWFDAQVLNLARSAAPLLDIVRTVSAANFPAKHVVGNVRAMGSGWVGEQGIRSGTDAPLPLAVEVPAGEWYALPTITEWALSDLSFDVEQWLRQELANEYAETLQGAIVGGVAGANKPIGFLAGPTPVTTDDGARAFGTLRYYPTGQAASLPTTTDAMINFLLDIVHGLRWKHRQNATWLMSALTMSTIRKFKDADGRPILLDSMISGQPAKLLGYPLVECEAMPDVAANSFPIAFGDFKAGYVLDQDASGLRITRDDITEKGFVKFYARRRVGGKILDSEAIRLAKIAAS